MKRGDEVLNLNDRNWYYVVRHDPSTEPLELGEVVIALSKYDAMNTPPMPLMTLTEEDIETTDKVDVCPRCGSAKVEGTEGIICNDCHYIFNKIELIKRNKFVKT